MGIFQRMSSLFRSSVNAKIDKMTDPAKEVELLVTEMEDQVRKGRAVVVKARASEKLLGTKVADLEKQVASLTQRAEAAVSSGDDALARRALEQRMSVEEILAEARRDRQEAAAYAAKLQSSLEAMEARVREYKMRKGTIQAKAKMARPVTTPGSVDAFEEFDRMTGRIDDAEVAADAERELDRDAQDREVARKIDRLAGTSAVDDRLAALKEKMARKDGE